MSNNRTIGQKGEDIACEYLEKLGYRILCRNIHYSRFCELDIVALDKSTLVAIEVKSRTSFSCGDPMEAITKTKYQNIKKGLFNYLGENPQYKKYRIDVISIMLSDKPIINHLKNV